MPRLMAFTLAAVCVFAASPAFAQSIALGVRAGAASATIDGFDASGVDIERRTGMSIGAFAELGFGGMLSIQPEVLFTQKGTTMTSGVSGTSEVGLTLSYAEVPVVAKLRMPVPGASPYVFVGPVFGMRTGCTGSAEIQGVSIEADCDDASLEGTISEFEDFDMGLLLGLGAGFGLGPGELSADFRYNAGLRSINTAAEAADAKNRALAIMLGYAIRLGM